MQSSMSTLDQAVLAMQSLIKKIKPQKSTPLKSCVVALYTADAQGQLRYSGCIGLLTLDMDRELKTPMLRLYNMQSVSLVFQVQLYYQFINYYKMVHATFYTFQYPRGVIGLLFKSKDDADIMKVKISSASPKRAQLQQLKKRKAEQLQKKRKQGSFFNKLKGIFGNDEDEKQQKVASQVLSVRKQMNIDLKTGKLNTENMPPQWLQIFDSLKLTKQDLNNHQITNMLAEEAIMTQAKIQAQKTQNKYLTNKLKQADEQQRQYYQAVRKTQILNIPPPPPPPPLLISPPELQQARTSTITKRANLMDQIRNQKIKLKQVEVKQQGQIGVDISNMNKQQRKDLSEHLRMRLKNRAAALNRRPASGTFEEEQN